jgi:Mce-associated membrane protein
MRRLSPQIATIALGVLAVALAVFTGVYAVRVYHGKDAADQRAKATQSARQMGVNLMTISASSAQKDLDRIVSGTTGNLKNKLSSQSKTLLSTLTQTQAKSTVSQVEAGVVSMDGDSAEVMVSLNGTVTNPKVKDGAPRAYRYLMELSRVGDRWLVSDLEVVP